MIQTVEKRFWEKVIKTDSCWLWKGCLTKGYGMIGLKKGKMVAAHRFSYELANGEIKDGLFVCHKCDVRNCVNPEHLFLGTAKDNMQDMVKKKRHYASKITHCPQGHEYTADNLIKSRRRGRECRTCANTKQKLKAAEKASIKRELELNTAANEYLEMRQKVEADLISAVGWHPLKELLVSFAKAKLKAPTTLKPK